MTSIDDLRPVFRRAQSGDLKAYSSLVTRFQDMAVGYAYHALGDFHLAEDAAQEAFIEAYLNLEKVYGIESFPRWLRKIVFKHCGRINRRRRLSSARLETAGELVSPDSDPAAISEREQLRDEVRQAIDSLPAGARSAVTLFYISDYSQREISEFLGIPVNTVKSRLHTGRKQLRERTIHMVEEDLRANRPSRDKAFDSQVQKGLRGVYVDRTAICLIDGREGRLLYRGYAISDLVERSTFEETAYLLLRGSLPTPSELDGFDRELKDNRVLPGVVLDLIEHLKDGQTIDVLRTAISAMGTLEPGASDVSAEAAQRQGIRLIAATPTIVTAHARVKAGKSPITPLTQLGHAANFLHMLKGKSPGTEEARLLDQALIAHAEHGANASSFAARVAASTGADPYAAVSAAVAALKGRSHGGATELVMDMIEEIRDEESVPGYIKSILDRGATVPGFGHAVYRVTDPRAIHLRAGAETLTAKRGRMEQLSLLDAVVEAMGSHSHRGMGPNVDLWSAAVYRLLDIPKALLSSVFAIARIPGWLAQVTEQYDAKTLVRPRLLYDGPADLQYVALTERE